MVSSTDPVIEALARCIAERSAAATDRGELFVVGLCGPQGSGKSTMTERIKTLLEARGLRAAALALDDLYLPRDARERLARTVHPLFRTRGVPGTHDIGLGLRALAALRERGVVSLPVFDKAADDRRPPTDWVHVRAPVDIVIFEGWCVGACPEAEVALVQPINALESEEDPHGVWRRYANESLSGAYQTLFGQIDLMVLLAAPGFNVVYRWRAEQENDLRRTLAAQGGDVSRLMTDQQMWRFISHYERLTHHVLREMPARADIVIHLDEHRRKRIEYRAP